MSDIELAFAHPEDRAEASASAAPRDRISLRDWLLRENYTAPSIHWMANYATRDDFGTAVTAAFATDPDGNVIELTDVGPLVP